MPKQPLDDPLDKEPVKKSRMVASWHLIRMAPWWLIAAIVFGLFHLYWCSKRGDKLLQHVAATDHSACTGRATSCSNKVRRHVAATNRFVCTGELLWNLCLRNRIWSLQQVAKNQIILNLCDVLRRQILWQRQRFSQKFSSTHEAICRCNVLPRHVAATCRLVCTDLKVSTIHKRMLRTLIVL